MVLLHSISFFDSRTMDTDSPLRRLRGKMKSRAIALVGIAEVMKIRKSRGVACDGARGGGASPPNLEKETSSIPSETLSGLIARMRGIS